MKTELKSIARLKAEENPAYALQNIAADRWMREGDTDYDNGYRKAVSQLEEVDWHIEAFFRPDRNMGLALGKYLGATKDGCVTEINADRIGFIPYLPAGKVQQQFEVIRMFREMAEAERIPKELLKEKLSDAELAKAEYVADLREAWKANGLVEEAMIDGKRELLLFHDTIRMAEAYLEGSLHQFRKQTLSHNMETILADLRSIDDFKQEHKFEGRKLIPAKDWDVKKYPVLRAMDGLYWRRANDYFSEFNGTAQLFMQDELLEPMLLREEDIQRAVKGMKKGTTGTAG